MLNTRINRIKLGLIWGAISVLLAGGWAMAQILGLGPYSGGTLKEIYEISQPTTAPTSYTLEIKPARDGFRITTFTETERQLEEIGGETGITGLLGTLGFHYLSGISAIDLSPLAALDEQEVEPNKSYLLPDGARLETQDRSKIAGIDVIMGIYTHPKFPNKRVQVALSDLSTRKLLAFPPLLQIEVQQRGQFQVTNKLLLTEFMYNP